MPRTRAHYGAAVRAIADWAPAELRRGRPIDEVGRKAVRRRNDLMRRFRAGIPVDVLRLIEARNRVKYGDEVGPGADDLLARYGSWETVIAAAARPAR